jgi:transcriptional regulator with XRE-family HTH domain
LKGTIFEAMHLERISFIQNLGKSIRQHRLEKSLTLEFLALKTGLDYSHLSKIERGITNPSAFNLFIISSVLEVPVCKLMNDLKC